MLLAGWEDPLVMLDAEMVQLRYEGVLIPKHAEQLRAKIIPDAPDREARIEEVFNVLASARKDPNFRYVQPNELDAIRAARPKRKRPLPPPRLSRAALLDKLHGAWTGRAVGCALGKPVEGWLRGRIKARLRDLGEWPLNDYFSLRNTGNGNLPCCPRSCRENIVCMEPDDDIHYTLIALHVLETHGSEFQWFHVANAWNSCLPYNAICTAETQAILNYNVKVPRMRAWEASKYTTPEFTSRYNNPYREWIGAQIRADGWGYVCPGDPERAAEFAWRDACWTHRANGIYGEMFIAAVTAAAFEINDWRTLMEIGLGEIPAKCRLAEDIRWAMRTLRTCPDWEAFMDLFDRRFHDMHPVHTNNNCLIVIASLYFGWGNPDLVAAISVMMGLDTDCNGATACSIAGILSGRKQFGGTLAAPLRDTIEPLVFGFQRVTMKELAERTLAVALRLQTPPQPCRKKR